MRDITTRRAELGSEHRELTAELKRLDELEHQQPNPELLDTLPVGACDIATLPEPVARRLFEAFRLEIHYNKTRHSALYRITLTGDTCPRHTRPPPTPCRSARRANGLSRKPRRPARPPHRSHLCGAPGRTRTCDLGIRSRYQAVSLPAVDGGE